MKERAHEYRSRENRSGPGRPPLGPAPRAQAHQRVTRERLTRLLGLWGDATAFKLPERLPDLLSSMWSSHTTSVRFGIAGTNESRMRDAVSPTSDSAVAASARADVVFASLRVVSTAVRAA